MISKSTPQLVFSYSGEPNSSIGSSLLDVESSQCSDTMVCFDRYLSIWPLHNQTNPNIHNPKAVKDISLRIANDH